MASVQSAVFVAALVLLGAGVVLCILRAARGPTHFDRLVAFDMLVLDVAGVVLTVSMLLETDVFVDVVLIITLIGFVGTIALAAYLEGSLVE